MKGEDLHMSKLVLCRAPLLAMAVSLALTGGSMAAAAAMQSPQQVMNALATFPRVVLHTQILIDAKNYTRLPHENGEIKEGSEALTKSIAGEPGAFKAKVEPLLQKVDADSQSVADAANAHDDGKLATTHAALAVSVKALLASFPDSVQPPPPKPPKN
jgi:hypothetical protein